MKALLPFSGVVHLMNNKTLGIDVIYLGTKSKDKNLVSNIK